MAGRPRTLPNVGAMDTVTLNARIIGENLSTARQRYAWEYTTIPVVTKNRRGWKIINIIRGNNTTLDGWNDTLRAVVTVDAPLTTT